MIKKSKKYAYILLLLAFIVSSILFYYNLQPEKKEELKEFHDILYYEVTDKIVGFYENKEQKLIEANKDFSTFVRADYETGHDYLLFRDGIYEIQDEKLRFLSSMPYLDSALYIENDTFYYSDTQTIYAYSLSKKYATPLVDTNDPLFFLAFNKLFYNFNGNIYCYDLKTKENRLLVENARALAMNNQNLYIIMNNQSYLYHIDTYTIGACFSQNIYHQIFSYESGFVYLENPREIYFVDYEGNKELLWTTSEDITSIFKGRVDNLIIQTSEHNYAYDLGLRKIREI